MNLMEESFQNKEKKKKKRTTTIILILIVIVLISIIGILIYLAQIQNSKLKIYLDGKNNESIKDTLQIGDDGTIYVQIKAIAPYLGYKSFDGDYLEKSENSYKCYAETNGNEEVANFELGSKEIWKLDITQADNNYEYEETNYPVKSIDGKLYAEKSAIEKAFNVSFEYDKNKNTITILTMPYLINAYTSKVLDYGYKEISDVFANKKAVLNDMIVVKKDDKTMGVIRATNGEPILEAKYDNITYLADTGDFIVETNKKLGVLAKDGTTKIRITYDNIKLMDSQSKLFLVQKDNQYGVLDVRGNIKIDINNDNIGLDVDLSKFERNDIKNKYIIADKLIPVKKDKYWGLYDINGNKVVDYVYDSFGYVSSNNKVYSLLVIPNYNTIVACKDKKYTLINSLGKELFAPIADDIYIDIEGNDKKYIISANNRTYNAEEFLKSLGVVAVSPENNNNDNSNITNQTSKENVVQEEQSNEQNQENQNNNDDEESNNNQEE